MNRLAHRLGPWVERLGIEFTLIKSHGILGAVVALCVDRSLGKRKWVEMWVV